MARAPFLKISLGPDLTQSIRRRSVQRPCLIDMLSLRAAIDRTRADKDETLWDTRFLKPPTEVDSTIDIDIIERLCLSLIHRNGMRLASGMNHHIEAPVESGDVTSQVASHRMTVTSAQRRDIIML
jgi:hypothetical protein